MHTQGQIMPKNTESTPHTACFVNKSPFDFTINETGGQEGHILEGDVQLSLIFTRFLAN